MKPNELRIGNWAADSDGDYFQIEELSPVLKNGEYRWQWLNDIKPIPLTPEILEKAGFVKDDIWVYSHPVLKCRWITQNLSGKELDKPFLRLDSTLKPPFIKTDIYYLHQLQNLYFALTGEELEIKELTQSCRPV